MKNSTKHRDWNSREGEIYILIRDGNFNPIYEKSIGLNDKKGMIRLVYDLKIKGIDFTIDSKEVDLWW